MHKLSRLCAPNVHTLVKAARGQMLAIRTEGNGINGFRMLRKRMYATATFHIPKTHGGIKRGGGEYQIRIGIVGARSRG